MTVESLPSNAALDATASICSDARRPSRDHHWTMLGVAFAILVALCVLRLSETDKVTVGSSRIALPELCGSRALFDIHCPGCGLTRSFVALAAGDLQQSLRFHRLGWLMALAVIAQIPYRIFALWERPTNAVQRAWPTWFGYGLIGALLVNWLIT